MPKFLVRKVSRVRKLKEMPHGEAVLALAGQRFQLRKLKVSGPCLPVKSKDIKFEGDLFVPGKGLLHLRFFVSQVYQCGSSYTFEDREVSCWAAEALLWKAQFDKNSTVEVELQPSALGFESHLDVAVRVNGQQIAPSQTKGAVTVNLDDAERLGQFFVTGNLE